MAIAKRIGEGQQAQPQPSFHGVSEGAQVKPCRAGGQRRSTTSRVVPIRLAGISSSLHSPDSRRTGTMQPQEPSMPIHVSEEQLRNAGDAPLRVTDPDTKEDYVVLKAAVFQQLSGIFGDDLHPSEAYAALHRTFSKDWGDPKMGDYDRYEDLKK
jgi:hypothetical protein